MSKIPAPRSALRPAPRKAEDALQDAFAYFRADKPRRSVKPVVADTALDQMYAYFGGNG